MPTFDLLLPPQSYTTWRPARPAGRSIRPLSMALRVVAFWIQRARQRRALAQLDDRLLRDIGITRYEATRESEKPFWR